MLPELKNIKTQYPFVWKNNYSTAEKDFIYSVRSLSIWIYTDFSVVATVTSFSPSGFRIKISGNSEQTLILVSGSGFFIISQSPYIKLNIPNCFVEYSNTNSSTANCNLQLLPEVVSYIPRGLKLFINNNQIQKEARPSQVQDATEWNQSTINFIPGYNFEGQVLQNSITLTAGAGLGIGSPSAQQMRKVLQPDIIHPDTDYIGMRSINGQSGNIQLDVSSSLYLKTSVVQSQTSTEACFKLCRKGT